MLLSFLYEKYWLFFLEVVLLLCTQLIKISDKKGMNYGKKE